MAEKPNGLAIPDDFQSLLSLNETASAAFERMPDSHKKEYINYINGASAVEARMERIDRAVEMIAKNTRLQ